MPDTLSYWTDGGYYSSVSCSWDTYTSLPLSWRRTFGWNGNSGGATDTTLFVNWRLTANLLNLGSVFFRSREFDNGICCIDRKWRHHDLKLAEPDSLRYSFALFFLNKCVSSKRLIRSKHAELLPCIEKSVNVTFCRFGTLSWPWSVFRKCGLQIIIIEVYVCLQNKYNGIFLKTSW